MKIKEKVANFYKKIKLAFYKNMFHRSEKHEELSSSEYFCLQCIYLMEKPTISQFANFLNISAPNATYKVKQLIKKGYITKEKSKQDKREYSLIPTQKMIDYFNEKDKNLSMSQIKECMDENEKKQMDAIIEMLNKKENA